MSLYISQAFIMKCVYTYFIYIYTFIYIKALHYFYIVYNTLYIIIQYFIQYIEFNYKMSIFIIISS